jgi:NADH:ubiquinone oxidoreductase subunit K
MLLAWPVLLSTLLFFAAFLGLVTSGALVIIVISALFLLNQPAFNAASTN